MPGFVWILVIITLVVLCIGIAKQREEEKESIEKAKLDKEKHEKAINEEIMQDEKASKFFEEKLEELYRENNISKSFKTDGISDYTRKYDFEGFCRRYGRPIYFCIAFDHQNQNLLFCSANSEGGNIRKIPYNKIVNVELVTTTTQHTYSINSSAASSNNTLKRAVTGGIIAGGAGAIVGALTAKDNNSAKSVVSQRTETKGVILYFSDLEAPIFKIGCFLEFQYQSIYATVLAIISQNQQNNITSDLENCNNEW